ncbi:MBL fold metallo-hydrolase [Pedobacter rhizosphaerae]|uniref:Glyoxylase, beta-lactamase superfamily II n=1 Tax=Pedobacter rhizosphaerae TaxID=390241 RepID=A0A1H9V726_9SPHI|nr:MBL fold metallo-hydrolase [Pedobacter rhizosphaerae]SES17053.1 Glyoxylase, beta-lactamase superfamily II [Pedobacter rhizosphaerae]
MKIKQLYEKCLSQASYYIEHNGEAVVIDPLRDVNAYIELAERDLAKITYIFETHFHADFVSGHLELAARTGATIVMGPGAETAFPSHQARDGEKFRIGGATLELLHTPGHTLESSCFLLRDENGLENAVFTGDTLFLGDVGRPDLAQSPDKNISQEDLAGMLYDSLRAKILPLPDHTIIYPGHGAGSACGKNMSKETVGDLGSQKMTNYALAEDLSRENFIAELCNNLAAPPAYFPMNVDMNVKGYRLLDEVLNEGMKPLSPLVFKKRMRTPGTLILDTRKPDVFATGHIAGSINIGLDGSFAPWVGALIPIKQESILIVAEQGRETEVIRRLARIGYHQCDGYLSGGISEWKALGEPVESVESISAAAFQSLLSDHKHGVIDVRAGSEYHQGNVPEALHIPLDQSVYTDNRIDNNKDYLVYCAGGYRSMIFISLLKAKGFNKLINIEGGYNAIRLAAENSHQ